MKHCVAISILFCISLSLSAQQAGADYDTNYIKSYRDLMVVTFVTSLNSNSLRLSDDKGEVVSFSTNLPNSYGFALDYKWLTFEYTTTLPGATADPMRGQTTAKGIGFGMTGRKWWFRNFLNSYKGYYLENPQYFNPDFNPATDFYPHREDVFTRTYFANLNYGFNHRRFSNMASLWQLERQKISAGTWTAGASFSYIEFGADSALIPQSARDFFGFGAEVTSHSFRSIGLNGGYLYTFVFGLDKKFFASLAFIPGVSLQKGTSEAEGTDESEQKTAMGGMTETRFVAGFNGDQFYTAISTIGYNIINPSIRENPVSSFYGTVRFVAGIRFKLPESNHEFLKKIGL